MMTPDALKHAIEIISEIERRDIGFDYRTIKCRQLQEWLIEQTEFKSDLNELKAAFGTYGTMPVFQYPRQDAHNPDAKPFAFSTANNPHRDAPVTDEFDEPDEGDF